MQNNFSIQVLRVVKSFWLTSKKIPRTMRLVILFLFCFVGLTNATDSYAQSAKVTMNVRNQTVEDVLRAIEKQTEFSFFYNNAHINLKRLVTISANRNDIFKVLDEVFKNTNVEYKVIDKKIILSTELASVEQAHQEKVKVSGRVVDAAGEPVIGASVIEKGSSNGTITDMDGNFTLNVGSKDAILEISYIGYQGQSLKVTLGKTLSVVLKEDTQSLDEVVVVGFGVQKKANLTGAVSQVKMDDVLGSRPVVNAMSALQGAMPGLQITPNNDAAGPGQSKSFNIRGTTSINGGGPLVLIDNVPGDIDMLNPEDIESVSVLKDAASAAIYGARAAFGVILVTTKKAKKGDGFHVNYNNNFGFQSSINRPEQADGLEWMQAYLDGEFNAGKYYTGQDIKTWMNYLTEYRKNPGKFQTTGDGVYVDPETGLNYYLNEKDLYANMLDDYGFLQAHNVSLSGGTDKLAYRLSLGYNSEQGILITDKDRYKRLSGSAYISAEITSWLTQSVDIRYAQSDKNMPVTSDKTGLYDMRLPVVYPEGSLTLPDGTSLMTNTPSNVLRMATDNNTIRDNARILSKTVLKPLKGLEVAFEYTFDKTWSNQNVNKASIDYTTVELAKIQTATTSSLETTHQSTDYNAINLYANYRYSWNDTHNLSLMGGFNQESSDWKKLYTYSYDMINEKYPSHSTATGENKVITDDHRVYTVRGAFYRVNYDYKGKYLAELACRYDGSYRYAPGSRWAFFPSASVGWRISEESFIKDNFKFVDNLKLRFSAGRSGQDAGDPFQYFSGYTLNSGGYVFSQGNYTNGVASPVMINKNLTWIKVNMYNIGIDFSIFNRLIAVEFDIYQRDRSGLLADRYGSLPNTFGSKLPQENLNGDRTRGIEFTLTHTNKIGDFHYSVSGNFNLARTQRRYIESGPYKSSMERWRNQASNRWGDFIWGYQTDGRFQNFDEINTYPIQNGDNGNSKELPGDYILKDVNGDGVVNDLDKTPLFWSGSPLIHYGFNVEASWKNFDFYALFQGSALYTVQFDEVYAKMLCFKGGNTPEYFYDRWHLSDPYDANSEWIPGEWPAIRLEQDMGSFYTRDSQIWRKNASYLRLKTIEIGYTFSPRLMHKLGIGSLRIYANGNNLFTVCDPFVKAFDPEKIEGDYSAGLNYPLNKSFNFGLTLNF